MAKLYFRNLILFALIFILLTIGVYTLYISLTVKSSYSKNQNIIDAHILNILDSELSKHPQRDWNNLLKKLAPRFQSSSTISITKTSSLKKSILKNKTFQHGGITFTYKHPVVDGTFLSLFITSYKKITSNANYTIQLSTGLDLLDTINTKSQWIASYLYKQLHNHPIKHWKSIISKLISNKLNGLQIYMIKPSILPQWIQEKLKHTTSITFDTIYFKKNILDHPNNKPYQYLANLTLKEKILNIISYKPTVTVVMQSPNKNHIIIISNLYTEATQFTRIIPFLCTLFIALLVLAWIWTFPIYQGIKKLQLLAKSYSEGEFIYNVKLHKHLTLYPLYKSLISMGRQIERNINTHKDLTNAISHELRHPLARIRFSLEMIEETQQNSLYIKKIKKYITEQDNLLDELLTYAKYNQKNTELMLSKVDFSSILDEFYSNFKNDYPNRNYIYINKLKTIKLYSYIDTKLIKRALLNILANAYKYSKQTISISLECNKSNYIVLTIEDDGPGISKPSIHKVFEPFAQGDLIKGNSYGLGLAISKGVINAHEGSIRVTNSSPLRLGGAAFIIKIPTIKTDI